MTDVARGFVVGWNIVAGFVFGSLVALLNYWFGFQSGRRDGFRSSIMHCDELADAMTAIRNKVDFSRNNVQQQTTPVDLTINDLGYLNETIKYLRTPATRRRKAGR